MSSVPPPAPSSFDDPRVPRSLRLAAALSWRFLLVGAAVLALAYALAAVRVVVVPLVTAVFFAALLYPFVAGLVRRGVPRTLAAAIVLLLALAVVAGTIAILAPAVAEEIGDADISVSDGVAELTSWLSNGPFALSESQVANWRDQAEEQLRSQSGRILGGVFGGAYFVLEIAAGLAIAFVTLFFLLKDGERIWAWVTRLFPQRAQEDVERIGELAWSSVTGYLRGIIVVAAVDAFFIGLALWLLGVPLVLPLALLTFVGGFFPIVGALTAGFAAAMVALVANGVTTALLVVGATILVQQLESNLLQPVVVGRAVQVHPLGILLAVAAGGVLWGVAGAFFAVPLAAVVNQAATHLANRRRVIAPEPGG